MVLLPFAEKGAFWLCLMMASASRSESGNPNAADAVEGSHLGFVAQASPPNVAKISIAVDLIQAVG